MLVLLPEVGLIAIHPHALSKRHPQTELLPLSLSLSLMWGSAWSLPQSERRGGRWWEACASGGGGEGDKKQRSGRVAEKQRKDRIAGVFDGWELERKTEVRALFSIICFSCSFFFSQCEEALLPYVCSEQFCFCQRKNNGTMATFDGQTSV